MPPWPSRLSSSNSPIVRSADVARRLRVRHFARDRVGVGRGVGGHDEDFGQKCAWVGAKVLAEGVSAVVAQVFRLLLAPAGVQEENLPGVWLVADQGVETA